MGKRALKIWNGRGDFWKLDGHIFVCAETKTQAVKLINQAGYSSGRMNLHELNTYYNEGCWGKDMNGITPEPGVWFQPKISATESCICNIEICEFNRAHKDDCPRKPRRLSTAYVSETIIEELEHRADVLEDVCEQDELPIDASERIDVAYLRSAIRKMKDRVKPDANELQVVNDEMMVIESADGMIEIWWEWCYAMVWLGLLPKYDRTAVTSGGKPKVIRIDGVEYDIGRGWK